MINTTRKLGLFCGIVCSMVIISGCASPYVLRRNAKTLGLKENHGVVLFTAKFKKDPLPKKKQQTYSVGNIQIQEINQYKDFKRKPITLIPVSTGESYNKQEDLYLFSLKLPNGTYNLSMIYGMVREWLWVLSPIECNKFFDVDPEQVHYLGRMDVLLKESKPYYLPSFKVNKNYKNDIDRFRSNYISLESEDIKIEEDLFY